MTSLLGLLGHQGPTTAAAAAAAAPLEEADRCRREAAGKREKAHRCQKVFRLMSSTTCAMVFVS
jgi:hypothetical protein